MSDSTLEWNKEYFLKLLKFGVKKWIDANAISPRLLKIVRFFQGKIQGYLIVFQKLVPRVPIVEGFPALKEMGYSLKGNQNCFFEHSDRFLKDMTPHLWQEYWKTQKQYDLKSPLAMIPATKSNIYPKVMNKFRTEGTPWFILIDA